MSPYLQKAVSQRRNYCITVATHAGYNKTRKGVDSGPEKARAVIAEWILQYVRVGEPFLAGIITEGTAIHAAMTGRGAQVRKETVIRFGGVVPPQYEDTLTEERIRELLNDLASILGEAFQQRHVYVDYLDTSWVLENIDFPDDLPS